VADCQAAVGGIVSQWKGKLRVSHDEVGRGGFGSTLDGHWLGQKESWVQIFTFKVSGFKEIEKHDFPIGTRKTGKI